MNDQSIPPEVEKWNKQREEVMKWESQRRLHVSQCIQDEAYSKAMDEIKRLKQLSETLDNLLRSTATERDDVKALLIRAADALEEVEALVIEPVPGGSEGASMLIAELRKAAE